MYKSNLTLVGTVILTGTFMFSSIASAVDNGSNVNINVGRHDNNPPPRINDQLACYQWDIFPNERFKLNVKNHSPLSERREEQNFGHAKQTAFSVHGKHVIFEHMATVEGTVVTAAKTSGSSGHPTGQTGAHLGLLAKWVRGDGANDFARSVTVECTTDEISSTPDTWTCESRNEFDVYHGFSKLTKVDETRDEACSTFEDGKTAAQALTADSIKGNASFMNQKP